MRFRSHAAHSYGRLYMFVPAFTVTVSNILLTKTTRLLWNADSNQPKSKSFWNETSITGSLVALPTGPPDKPVINVGRTTANTITVRWKSPDDGGRPITSYRIQIRPEDGNTWQDCPDIEQKGAEMSCSFTDLDSGTKYVVRVIVVNEIGTSEPDVEQVKTEAGTYNAKCFMDWTVLGSSGRTKFIILHRGKRALFRRLSRCFRSGAEHVILRVPVVQRLITLITD